MKIFAKHSVFPVQVSENKDVCDTSFHAKQTRNKFSAGESRATELFEIAHCDIWGPYHVPSHVELTTFLL